MLSPVEQIQREQAMTTLDPTLIPALDAIIGALERGPRRDVSEAPADYHLECFRRQCERDAELREVMQIDDEPRWQDERSYEQFGEEQQGYHGDRRP
jgi:hypothetical protein